MARDHYIAPIVTEDVQAVRLGAGNTTGDNYSYLDSGKAVKFVGDSRYDLCAAGDAIDGFVHSVELALQNGYTIGGVVRKGVVYATADGLQVTPGTGSIAAGDYVVAGTATAKGTALTAFPKVVKATLQPGITEAGTVADVNDMLAIAMRPWRVVSLSGGNGAVGTKLVIERV